MRFFVMLQGRGAAEAGAWCEPLWPQGIQVSMDDDSSPPHVTRERWDSRRSVAGYGVIRATSRAEAIEWARQVFERVGPGAGAIEVRELYDTDSFCNASAPAPSPLVADPAARRYVAFLKADAATEAGVLPTEKLVSEMFALLAEIAAEGCLVSGDGLKPSAHGARVELSGGKVRVIDGPFAETKELVAGVLVVRARSEAQVVDWARRMLEIHLRGTQGSAGEVEIRHALG